jgi:hypothetical protein
MTNSQLRRNLQFKQTIPIFLLFKNSPHSSHKQMAQMKYSIWLIRTKMEYWLHYKLSLKLSRWTLMKILYKNYTKFWIRILMAMWLERSSLSIFKSKLKSRRITGKLWVRSKWLIRSILKQRYSICVLKLIIWIKKLKTKALISLKNMNKSMKNINRKWRNWNKIRRKQKNHMQKIHHRTLLRFKLKINWSNR